MPPILPVSCDQPGEGSDEDLRVFNNDNIVTLPPVSDSPEDSDGFDINQSHDGYQLLAQSLENEENLESEEDSEDDTSPSPDIATDAILQPTNEVNPTSFQVGANLTEQTPKTIEMAPEHIEKIKDVMKGIMLPENNMPKWTSSISEDDWKAQLYARLNIPMNEQPNTKDVYTE